jgi:hypothetical protein
VGIGECEVAKGGNLDRLIFEAALHSLFQLTLLMMDEQERENANDEDLEEDKGGHELAANRSWSQHRHTVSEKRSAKKAVSKRAASEKLSAKHQLENAGENFWQKNRQRAVKSERK